MYSLTVLQAETKVKVLEAMVSEGVREDSFLASSSLLVFAGIPPPVAASPSFCRHMAILPRVSPCALSSFIRTPVLGFSTHLDAV